MGLLLWGGVWAVSRSRGRRSASGRRPPTAWLERAAAVAPAATTFGVASGLGIERLLARLWKLQSDELAILLGSVGSVGIILLAAGLGAGVWRGATHLVARLRRRGLPATTLSLLSAGCFLVLPAVACVTWLLATQGPALGRTGVAFWLLGALALGGLATLIRWTAARASFVDHAVVAGWLLLVAVTSVALAPPATEQGVGARLGGNLLRRLTDFDADGTSHWFGGGDCAPLDARRHPTARDEPQNGVDEDCDGHDAKPLKLQVAYHGGRSAQQARRYNIVWIIADGVRADHCSGAYGYERDTTPYLRRLAEESITFTRAFSQSSATIFSMSSMFTGADPASLTWDTSTGRPQLGDAHVTLAERLQPLGYSSAIFLTAWTARYYTGLQQGFSERYSTEALDRLGKSHSQRTAPLVTTQAIEFIEGAVAEQRPFFAAVYYHDTHFPHVLHPGEVDFGVSDIDRYDGEIAYVDRYIGFLLAYLRYRPKLWDDTVVVVTSDHGEEFGEHGGRTHARTCYVESTHVPLVLRVPGLKRQRVDAEVALLDIKPTLLELIGAPSDDEDLQGVSLLIPALAASRYPADRWISCAVTRQWKDEERFLQRAARSRQLTLLEAQTGTQLFDRRSDPKELHALADAGTHAPEAERLRQWLSSLARGNFSDRF